MADWNAEVEARTWLRHDGMKCPHHLTAEGDDDEACLSALLGRAYEAGALAATRGLSEHAEGWDGPCACALCMGYGD